jgi:galactitol-specific phosphotransferase system IIC component
VTVKLQLVELPHVSLAVAFTVVVPTGKVLPLGGLATMVGGVQPPLAVTVKNTTAPAGPVATVVMLDEHAMLICR